MIDLYCVDCGEEIEIIYDQTSIKAKPCPCARDQGYTDGYEEGYEEGFEAAMKD